MSFRRRVVVFVAAAVLVSVALGSVATYVIVRGDLSSGINRQLRSLAAGVSVKRLPSAPARDAIPATTGRSVRSSRAGGGVDRVTRSRSGPRLAVGVNSALEWLTRVLAFRRLAARPAGFGRGAGRLRPVRDQ